MMHGSSFHVRVLAEMIHKFRDYLSWLSVCLKLEAE